MCLDCGNPEPRRVRFAALIRLLAVCFAMAVMATSAPAATVHYVDNSAAGLNNGTSWSNAWASLGAITGLQAGDTVYISGGPSGSSQTYNIPSGFPVVNGTAANRITYQIGQDSAHNGTAIFSGSGTFLNSSANNFVISGDAGDGQMHFANAGFSVIEWITTSQANARLGYINFGQMAGSGGQNGNIMLISSVNGLEFDHNYVYDAAPDANAFAFIRCSGSTWDQNKIHHNTIILPHAAGSPGQGADGIETGGTSGVSVYNNTFSTYSTSYLGGQHQDGWQDTGGSSFVKIYNNTWINWGNYSIYGDATFGGLSHYWIYNNVIVVADPAVQSGSPGGVVIGVDGGATNNVTGFLDVVVANNLIDGMLNNQGISLNNITTHLASFASCFIGNNIFVNGGGISTVGNNNSSVANNIFLPAANGPKNFASYVPNGTNNDYHLISNATGLLNSGDNYFSYFTNDIAGMPRPVNGPWDIGPYQISSAFTNPVATLSLTPVVQNAADVDPVMPGVQVYEGTVVQYSAIATETGANAVSWQWAYQLNGGPQVVYTNGSGVVAPLVFNYTNGSGGSGYLWTLSANDGHTFLSSLLTTGVEAAPIVQAGLALPAASAGVNLPLVLSNGFISQTIAATNVTSGGHATFSFNLARPGNYVLQAAVNVSGAGNSMYVNIDGEPVDPYMIWDVPATSGVEQRMIGWRGNGVDVANQFVPKVFSLAPGAHQVVIVGRSAGVQLQNLNVLQVPSAPQNQRVFPSVFNAPSIPTGP